MKKVFILSIATLAVAATGCAYKSVLVSDHTGKAPNATSPSNTSTAPAKNADSTGTIILNGLDANPTNVATKGDKITFTVNAYNANKLPMEYSWASTKGTLSATRGQTVFWSPMKADGSVEKGLSTVQVLISDGNGATKQAALNLLIHADGSAVTQN